MVKNVRVRRFLIIIVIVYINQIKLTFSTFLNKSFSKVKSVKKKLEHKIDCNTMLIRQCNKVILMV